MKAFFVAPDGARVKLELRDIPTPAPKAGQLLVKVRGSCFNRGELIPGHGHANDVKQGGGECAGEIARLGEGVSGFREGDKVMGRCVGGWSEYALMDRREAVRIPERLSWEEAGAIPLAFMVVHDMLVTHGALKAGEWLLVTAISSGVGVAALQTAKALGAKVIGTSGSADKLARLKTLGLDVGVQTRGTGFHDAVMKATDGKGVNLIVNNVGGTVFPECMRSLAYEGRLATVGYLDRNMKSEIDLQMLHTNRLKLFGVSNKLRPASEREQSVRGFERDLLPMFADGRIKVLIDRVYPFNELPAALDYVQGDSLLGKVAVKM